MPEYAVVIRPFGGRILKDELAEIIAEWRVQSAFNIEDFGNSYKVIFKSKYDHDKALKNEWTTLRFNLLIILPWQPRMSPTPERNQFLGL